MTWLIQMFLACLLTWETMDCAVMLNDIVAAQEVEDRTSWYTIWVVWYPKDSLANEIVNYWYDQSSGDMDMILTFIAENGGFDAKKVSRTNDYWLCQLHYNRTNAVWIDDPRWSDPMYQADVCLDKYQAVPNPSKVWYGWKIRNRYKDRIYWF